MYRIVLADDEREEREGIAYLIEKYGYPLKITYDAKYLEIGISSKSDNVDAIFQRLQEGTGLQVEECSFWGDDLCLFQHK